MEDTPVHWLIDTGCTTTILSVNKYLAIPEDQRPELYEVDTVLVTADDTPLKILGRTIFNIKFGKQWVRHSVIVAKVTNEGLIGMDFLLEHKVSLDFANKTVHFHGEDFQAQCNSTRERACRVAISEGVMIPAGTRMIVEAKASHPLATGSWMVEPLQRSHGESSVLLARTLIQGDGIKLPIEVMNPTNEDTYLHPQTNVGIVTRVSLEESVHEKSSSNPSGPLPDEIQKLVDGIDIPLTSTQKKRVQALMKENLQVFTLPGEPKGRTDWVKHEIHVDTDVPIKQAVRRSPIHLRDAAEQEVQKMLKDDVIEPSNSPWASPVVLVRKKDGSLRYCIDYRKLNAVTRKDSYPLPRIDDSLDTLKSAKYFSTLDLASGYWQIELTDEAKEKSAFCTTSGLYQFRVMPFGLTNAPATFQRLMERVLAGLQWKICLVYIDDIIIFSSTVDDHLQQLGEVFGRLKAAGLKLKPKKCHLFQRKVRYLGHIVSEDGIETDPEKVEAIRKWERPSNVSELRSFLGLCSYYRRFVPDFATIARPLIKMTEKNVQFAWTEEQEESWRALKEKLVSPPVLMYPDPEVPFVLDTDASDFGIGAVLSQVQGGDERVVAYGSRVLTKQERRYCVTRRELLAVVHFIKYFRHYLVGRRFTLRTDHASLKWVKSFKEPEGQVARWLEVLETYDFELIHRPGIKHGNADALSRGPCSQCGGDHASEKIRRGRVRDSGARRVGTRSQKKEPPKATTWLGHLTVNLQDLQDAQDADPVLARVQSWVQRGERPAFDDVSLEGQELKFYWGQFRSLTTKDGILVRELERELLGPKLQILVPQAMRDEVLRECHEARTAGHLGRNKTTANVKRRFLWPGMRTDVEVYVKTCELCSKYKTSGKTRRAGMKVFQVGEPAERLCIDIVGPFNETCNGHKYCLVITDCFTKFVEIFPMRNQEAETVAAVVVREFVSRYGAPREIHTDQGRQFEATLFQEMCGLLGITKTRTTSFHPQSDGQSERNIKTLVKMLAMAADQKDDWDEHLPYISMAYRATVQESSGFSPNFLMFGRELAMPVDLMYPLTEEPPSESTHEYVKRLRGKLRYAYELARNSLRRSTERQKRLYNERVFGQRIHAGDLVWVMNKERKKGKTPKLQPKWKGPCLVTRAFNDVVVAVHLSPRKCSNLHVDLLKPCTVRKEPPWIKRLRRKLKL